ncbi:MAG: glutathione S-transferase N-terminal domain-containing protein [Paracoccaceae bacterium]
MTYHLILGDRSYSSWSLRGWLLFEKFGLQATERFVDFNGAGSFKPQTVGEQMADLAPARTVPTLITPEGALVWESLAIAEELATRHPGAGHWPGEAGARATARTLAAEMHSGFSALRAACPMNLRAAYRSYEPEAEVVADVRRLEAIWDHARSVAGGDGPWLFGAFSAADAFFAPVAARIAGYGLKVGAPAAAYVATHLADPAFRRWRAMGLAQGETLPWYARDHDQCDWPGPAPLPARAVAAGPSENAACPYSGKPVTQFLELDGRVFGFCNAFCRDKTVNDPEAWPKFMGIYHS